MGDSSLTTPPQRGFVERWVIALLLAFVFIPVAVLVFVPLIVALAKLWVVTVPVVLLVAFFFFVRWRRSTA